jgi:signal peptidase I
MLTVKRIRLRSWLITAALVVLAALGWLFLAPTAIGGSTTYVVTGGNSMEPRFHSGDLALVRPAGHYEVGQIVAYHSPLLHVVVLHRIIARDGNRYVFKGDHNNFIDPTRPTRSGLLGALWLHLPHGGWVIRWIHTPLIAAGLRAVLAVPLLLGAGETRRRRRRRRSAASHAPAMPVSTREHRIAGPAAIQMLGAASAVACVVCLAAAAFAFTSPLHKLTRAKISYSQHVAFGYHAAAPPGLVYPTGVVRTGDPIFLALVHDLSIKIDYRLASAAAHELAGTESVTLRLTGPGGWTRTIQAGPPHRFSGNHATSEVTLDLAYLRALFGRVEKLTGLSPGSGYTITVAPRVRVRGTLGGQAVADRFDPVLSFDLEALQLTLGGGSAGSSSGLADSKSGVVTATTTGSNSLDVGGLAIPIATLRLIALGCLLLAAVAGLLALALRHRRPVDEVARIKARYGQLIVPVVAVSDEMFWPPFDVTSIKALARLAELTQRVILHHHADGVDTYLVSDDATVYRYQVRAPASPELQALPDPPGEDAGEETPPLAA